MISAQLSNAWIPPSSTQMTTQHIWRTRSSTTPPCGSLANPMQPLPTTQTYRHSFGLIILLTDSNGLAAHISFKFYKSRRVTRSVLAVEVIAFAHLFDEIFTLRAQLEQAFNRPIPLYLLTDSNSLFDIIGKSSCTSEKRLMLDISATQQAYNAELISNIGFVRSP